MNIVIVKPLRDYIKLIIYLVACKKCKKQGVGGTITFMSRMANYRSKTKKSCNIDKHFIEEINHSIEDFYIQIIVQFIVYRNTWLGN